MAGYGYPFAAAGVPAPANATTTNPPSRWWAQGGGHGTAGLAAHPGNAPGVGGGAAGTTFGAVASGALFTPNAVGVGGLAGPTGPTMGGAGQPAAAMNMGHPMAAAGVWGPQTKRNCRGRGATTSSGITMCRPGGARNEGDIAREAGVDGSPAQLVLPIVCNVHFSTAYPVRPFELATYHTCDFLAWPPSL